MPRHLHLLLKLLGLGLVTGSGFRIALLVAHADQWSEASGIEAWRALFGRGLLFDLYVNAWLLVVPFLILSMRYALRRESPVPFRWARWLWTLPFLAVLFCACADLPFYAYTNMRLTDLALSTAQTIRQSLKELVSTPPYLMALIAFVVLAWLTVRITRAWFSAAAAPERSTGVYARWIALLLPIGPLLMGLRGTYDFGDAPLTGEDAYFSQTPFLNQLGTNAAFSFVESIGQDKVRYMSAEEAIAIARAQLGITGPVAGSPFARAVSFAEPPERRNVVLILVESLSANRLHRFGHPRDLMPFLESLMDSSIVFDRFYAAGTRTCNGIFSSLYGLPAIGSRHPMADPLMTSQGFHGLPGHLRDAGFANSFIYPGDAAFDNMGSFLLANGFDRFVSEADFADSIPRNSWGVTDHALYTKALAHIDSLDRTGHAWFTTLMTISSHKGYNVPHDIAGFAPTSLEPDEGIYEYADRALAEFFAAARTAPWFANTVFVILGDHGQRFDPLYEVPLAYHHVPLVIHAPGLVVPGIRRGFGTQVDVQETVLGALRMPHVNNSLGQDLMRHAYDAAYFCSDHRIAALNEYSYWIRSGEIERLYDYPSRGTEDLSTERAADRDSLKRFAEGMVQAAAWMVESRMARGGVTDSPPERTEANH